MMTIKTKTDLVKLAAEHLGIPVIDLPFENEVTALPLPLWVDLDLPVTEAEMLDIVGEPCPDYEEDCPVCRAHTQFHATGTIPRFEERSTLLHLAKGCFYVEDGQLKDIMSGEERKDEE